MWQRRLAAAGLGLVLGGLVHLSIIGAMSLHLQAQETRLEQTPRFEIQKVSVPSALIQSKESKLQQGWILVTERGRPETWRALVRHQNGRSRVLVRLKRLQSGVPTKVQVGTSKEPNAVRIPQVSWARRELTMEATAYDPGPVNYDRGYVGTTSIGERARFGIIAVDPKVIAYRSLLFVEGYGPGLAADTGGAIRGKRLDLCFNSTDEAVRYGRRKTKAYVLGYLPASEARQIRLAVAQD